jgi:hypothetical protein
MITNREKTEVFVEKPTLVPFLSTTNFIWTDLGLNLDLRCERPMPNRLSNGGNLTSF